MSECRFLGHRMSAAPTYRRDSKLTADGQNSGCPMSAVNVRPIRSGRRKSGTSIIEFSLCLPLLVALTLGTIQYGYSFFVYAELEQAVRAAARYASVRSYGSSTTTPDSAYLTAVRNVAVYGNPAGGTGPVVPGLTTDKVAVQVSFRNAVPAAVAVTVNDYRMPQIVGSVALINKPSVQFAYLGIYAPPI